MAGSSAQWNNYDYLNAQKNIFMFDNIHEMDNGEFDYRVSFADDPEDSYIYCFKDEGCHIIYHRFLPEDYADFAF